MTLEQNLIINNFIENYNRNEEEFNLVIDKLNEFLSPFFIDYQNSHQNEFYISLKLVGDSILKSNLDNNEVHNIIVECCYINEDNLKFSENRSKQGNIGRIITDSFNYSQNLVLPTITEIQNSLLKYIVLKGLNLKAYNRKNCIYINFLDYKFSLIFVSKNYNSNSDYNLTIRGENYKLDLELMHQNLLEKNAQTNGNFFKLIKFYKVIEKELILIDKIKINASRKLYFYENLLFNVPNELLKNENIYDNFIESYNYLLNAKKEKNLNLFVDASKNKLINDEYKLFAKYYITTFDIYKVIKQCKIFIENIDNILSSNN